MDVPGSSVSLMYSVWRSSTFEGIGMGVAAESWSIQRSGEASNEGRYTAHVLLSGHIEQIDRSSHVQKLERLGHENTNDERNHGR